jgi:hypothetical protein
MTVAVVKMSGKYIFVHSMPLFRARATHTRRQL